MEVGGLHWQISEQMDGSNSIYWWIYIGGYIGTSILN